MARSAANVTRDIFNVLALKKETTEKLELGKGAAHKNMQQHVLDNDKTLVKSQGRSAAKKDFTSSTG